MSAAYISLTYSILGQLANISVFESHHQSIFIHFHIVTFESEAEYLAELAQKTDFNEKNSISRSFKVTNFTVIEKRTRHSVITLVLALQVLKTWRVKLRKIVFDHPTFV